MSLDLQSLRTAKAALDEGLLDAQDYANVKNSFIKAQSIKAGVEAGFISAEDYSEARKAFFSGLGVIHGAVASAAPVSAAPQPQVQPAAAAPAAAAPAAAATPSPASATHTSPAPSQPAATPPPAAATAPPPVAVPQATTPEGDAPKSASGGSLAPTPTALTDRGGAAAVADKRSMAGIQVDADAVNIIWEVNIKKRTQGRMQYRWVSYHIGPGGKQVEIEKCGAPESTWAEFVASLPDAQCRYGVFDYEYINSEGTKFGKLCFVSWAPDDAVVKKKMQHSSTKDFFRSMLEGIAVEVHATDKEDLGEKALRDRVATTVAKK